jgi:hypothetical protein
MARSILADRRDSPIAVIMKKHGEEQDIQTSKNYHLVLVAILDA